MGILSVPERTCICVLLCFVDPFLDLPPSDLLSVYKADKASGATKTVASEDALSLQSI